MTRTPGLMVSLLGLSLGLALSMPGAVAADCGSLGRVEHLAFAPVPRTRELAPLIRASGPLNSLYGTVRRFLSVVQLNPFPAGECPLPPPRPQTPSRSLQALGPQLASVHFLSTGTCRVRFLVLHSLFLPHASSSSPALLFDLGPASFPLYAQIHHDKSGSWCQDSGGPPDKTEEGEGLPGQLQGLERSA